MIGSKKNYLYKVAYTFIILGLFTLNSCTKKIYRYQSNTINPHLFEEKDDFEVGMTASGLFGFHGAYAITDHFAIGAAISFFSESDTISIQDSLGMSIGDLTLNDTKTDYEIALNYFNSFPESEINYEIQLGFGYDNRTEKIESDLDLSNTIYNFGKRKSPLYYRLFIQPAIGKNGKNFDWSFATRFQLVNYRDLAISFPLRNFSNYSDMMIEPIVTVRGGYRFAKIMFQVGARFTTKNGPYDYFSMNMGVGLVFPLNKFTRKGSE